MSDTVFNYADILTTSIEPRVSIVQSEAATEPYDDWSGVRSPSRARRRMKLGHRQNIAQRRKPCAYRIENTIYIHPELYRAMAEKINDRVERDFENTIYGNWGAPRPTSSVLRLPRGRGVWGDGWPS